MAKFRQITRGAIISVAGLGTVLIALIAQFILGEGHVNLSKINARSLEIIGKNIGIDKAQADVPSSCISTGSDILGVSGSDSNGDSGGDDG